ncbi:hypothetical protein ABZ806_12355 [Spirillospora sp. NPDC047418]
MSGPRDTRETAEPAGTSGVPADPAPPSFGGAPTPAAPPEANADADAAPPATGPPAEPEPAAEPTAASATEPAAASATEPATAESAAEAASFRLPTFGLEAPWWAAESPDTTPPAAEPAPAAAESAPAAAEPEGGRDAPAAAPAAPREIAPVTGPPPGTLVAGTGVPPVDSRRAVPAEPIVKPPASAGDTDPDGFQAVHPEGAAPADETPEDETTVDNSVVNEAAEDGPASLSAFEKAKEAENAAAQTAVLVPDAILPRGVVPPTGSGPFPNPGPADGAAVGAGQAPVITPVYHAEGGVPLDTPPPPGPPPGTPPQRQGGGNRRRTVLIGGGAAVVLAAAIALFAIGGTGSDGKDEARKAAEPSASASAAPSAAAPAPSAGAPANIADEKTDPKDLAFRDVFPAKEIKLGGRIYLRDRWSLNRDLKYAARGAMLGTLEREQCRKIIRATFIDRESGLAVTSGIAVMPTKAAAMTVSKAGDPARYEWFRGMAGKHSPDIDRAGGYAAATVRGRYVAYAYVQWANGKKAKPGDPLIKQAAQQFLDYDLRPIEARTHN